MIITGDQEKILAAISEKSDGSMRLHHVEAIDKSALEARAKWLESLGLGLSEVVTAGLEHGSRVVRAYASETGRNIPLCDGLVTNSPGLYLSVTAADCPTLFLHDPKEQAVGIAHCGWKGLHRGIVENLVGLMRSSFYSSPDNLVAYVGPGIGPCHFEVKKDVAKLLCDYRALISEDGVTKLFLNKIITAKLFHLGLAGSHIHLDNNCTFCTRDEADGINIPNFKYFSARRDQNLTLETMMAIIGIRKNKESVV